MRAPRWLLALAAVPLVATVAVDPAAYAPFGPVKWAVVSTAVLLAGAAAARWGLGGVDRPTTLVWLAFLGWTAVCGFAGRDPWYAQAGTPERHAGLVLWLLCFVAFLTAQRAGPSAARPVARGAALAAVGIGLWSVVELLWRAPVASDATSARLAGPFGSAAFLGAACCLLGPVALGVALDRSTDRVGGGAPGDGADGRSSDRAWRRVGAVGAVGALVGLAGSGTRGAWLAALMVGVTVVVVRRRALVRHPEVAAAAGVAALLLFVAVAVVGPRGGAVATVDRSTPATARLDEWRVGARALREHWLLGTGPEGYRIVFPGVVDDAYERAYGRAVEVDRAHDVLLDLGITVGLPGLLAYLVLAGLVARRVWRALRGGRPLVAGVAAGVAAYGLQQLVLFPVAELEPVAWLLAGVVMAVEVRAVEWSRVLRPASLSLAALAAVAALLGGLDVAADREAARSVDAAAAGRSGAAVDAARRAVRLRPDQVRYRIAAARALAPLDRAGALAQLDAAGQWSPDEPALAVERAALLGTARAWQAVLDRDPGRAAAWLELGVAAAREGDGELARRAWQRAAELAPDDPRPWLNLARLHLDQREWAAARLALASAEDIAPGDPDAARLRRELARAEAGGA